MTKIETSAPAVQNDATSCADQDDFEVATDSLFQCSELLRT